MRPRYQLVLFLLAAFVLQWVPGIQRILGWYETFFHEVSHAMMAVITGGTVSRLALRLDGSGFVISQGGFGVLIAFAGYAGAILWGCALYRMASDGSHQSARWLSWGLLVLCLMVMIASWQDLITLGIVATLAGLVMWVLNRPQGYWPRAMIRGLGASVLVQALSSPLQILGHGGHNDAEILYQMVWLPPMVWVGLWLAIGCLAVRILWK